jgi:excisionase family DNA binding protein
MTASFAQLMTPAEVAAAFRVTTRTVAQWSRAGRLHAVRTPAAKGYGHRRYRRADVEALLRDDAEGGAA